MMLRVDYVERKHCACFASLSVLRISCSILIWGQRTKYATESVSLGFKQLTKWGSITGAAVLEPEIRRFDEA
jgi:hypothetical protein